MMRALIPALAVLLGAVLPAADAMALNPSRTYKQRPEKYNMEYQEKTVTTEDGAKLKVWDFAPKVPTTKLVLIVHNGEGNMADYLRRVDALRATRRVVMFDYRGFGESSEFEIDNNMMIYPHFLKDVQAAFDYCRKSHVAHFDVYGWGIGGGLALGVGYSRPESRSIVADTPFLSMEDLEERMSSWDEPMEVPFAGYDKRFEPKSAVEGAPGRAVKHVGLIVGSNDRTMSADGLKKLLNPKNKLVDKNIYVVENPDRKDNFKVQQAAYTAKLIEWLDTGS